MEIGLTDGLRKFAKMKPLPAAAETGPFFCWDANRVDVGGRKLLIVSNASNRLCAVSRMKGSDWAKIEAIAPQLIADAMMTGGASYEDYLAYMGAAGGISLSKTHGKKPLGCLSEIGNFLLPGEIDMGETIQLRLMERLNSEWICHCPTRRDYGRPCEWLAENLAERGLRR